jgi:tetrahydromethanopterin S-methyltransferase subunit G
MTVEVARAEFEARVGVLEREVEGEKMVTRYILEQTRRNGDDLAAVKTRLDRVETRLDGVETRLDRVEQKIDALRRDLPQIVGDTVRDVLAERHGKG